MIIFIYHHYRPTSAPLQGYDPHVTWMEHTLGKGGVECSIHSGGTSISK